MHRWMIKMVRDDYAAHGLPPPASWKSVPSPRVAQIVYTPATNPAGVVEFKKDLAASGNMVLVTDVWGRSCRKYFNSVMGEWVFLSSSVGTLASLSLGRARQPVESTIHNAMHQSLGHASARSRHRGVLVRSIWATPARRVRGRPSTSLVNGARRSSAFSGQLPKRSVARQSAVLALHGWVDHRIDDWFRAQEASSPGRGSTSAPIQRHRSGSR